MAVDDFDFVSLTRCTEYLLEQGIVGEAGTKGVVGEGGLVVGVFRYGYGGHFWRWYCRVCLHRIRSSILLILIASMAGPTV